MTGWYNTAGEGTPQTTSNLIPDGAPVTGRHEFGSGGMEAVNVNGETRLTHNRPMEHQSDPGQDTSQGVLASARSAGGGQIHGRNVHGSDQVMLPGGIPTSVTVAANLGYLQRNPDGTFSDIAPQGDRNAPAGSGDESEGEGEEDSEPEAPAEAALHLGDVGESAMASITESVDAGTAIRAMDEILTLGEVSEQSLERMATQAGVEPEAMLETLNTAHAAFHDAATGRMASRGVTDMDAFEAFVDDDPSMVEKLSTAARQMVVSNSTEALDGMIDAFLEKADHYMPEDVSEALEMAGFNHKPDGSGGLLVVTDNGMEVPFRTAVRQQIVRFI